MILYCSNVSQMNTVALFTTYLKLLRLNIMRRLQETTLWLKTVQVIYKICKKDLVPEKLTSFPLFNCSCWQFLWIASALTTLLEVRKDQSKFANMRTIYSTIKLYLCMSTFYINFIAMKQIDILDDKMRNNLVIFLNNH